jgi:hypothetical protein
MPNSGVNEDNGYWPLSASLLKGRPGGMRPSQTSLARRNWVEFVFMPWGMGKLTLPLEKTGSGKLAMPWLRIQDAALR